MTFTLVEGSLASPASAESVSRLAAENGNLPPDYLAFLRAHNGGEGDTGERFVILWRAEEVSTLNSEYEVGAYAPGIFLFGSNGGGEAYGFDLQSPGRPVVSIPFVGLDRRYAEPVADSISALLTPAKRKQGGRQQRREQGLEVWDIHPVILGGDPRDPANKTLLTRDQHIEAVRFWNQKISELRKNRAS